MRARTTNQFTTWQSPDNPEDLRLNPTLSQGHTRLADTEPRDSPPPAPEHLRQSTGPGIDLWVQSAPLSMPQEGADNTRGKNGEGLRNCGDAKHPTDIRPVHGLHRLLGTGNMFPPLQEARDPSFATNIASACKMHWSPLATNS